jgi:glycosyltransferase involved in cell wall biosynthesis
MLISVIIPVYNAEKYIIKAVESALQFSEVAEVLLIEDCSPDNALEVCQQLELKYSRVKLIQHPDRKNYGAGASRNLGIANAKCEYVAFLDADDFYLPNRFDADKKIFAECSKAEGVYNAIGIHFYSKESESNFRKTQLNEITSVTDYVDSITLFESFIWLKPSCGYFHLDGLTIKREALNNLNYWFNPELRLHQDSDFIIRLAYFANLQAGEIKVPTAIRGVHDQNRIISLQSDREKVKQNQKKLWKSLYQWGVKESISDNYLLQIRRIFITKDIVSKSYLLAWFSFIINIHKDTQIISNPTFYNQLHYHFYGTNRISAFLLRVKYKAFNLLGIN